MITYRKHGVNPIPIPSISPRIPGLLPLSVARQQTAGYPKIFACAAAESLHTYIHTRALHTIYTHSYSLFRGPGVTRYNVYNNNIIYNVYIRF